MSLVYLTSPTLSVKCVERSKVCSAKTFIMPKEECPL